MFAARCYDTFWDEAVSTQVGDPHIAKLLTGPLELRKPRTES